MPDTNIITLKQLAENLQVTTTTIRNKYVKQGMPVIRLSTRRLMFDYQEVLTWLKERK